MSARGSIIQPAHLVLACCVLLLLTGCGSKAGATAPRHITRTARPQVSNPNPAPTATDVSLPTPAPTLAVTPTAAPSPTAASTPTAVAAPAVTAASIQPRTASPGQTIQVTVTTVGTPSRIQLYIGSGAPNAPAPVAYSLVRSAAGTWTGTVPAPNVPGQYQYSVGIFDGTGTRHVAANDGWNLLVDGPTSAAAAPTAATSQAQPLYADIPLAPPFSYGNPVPAVFSAVGQQVTGSEIISTRRPDVSPSAVAQFYTIHFPRSGWTVDPSTIPAPGATSFTMVATSGNRVCVVQYQDFTIDLFYGTTG